MPLTFQVAIFISGLVIAPRNGMESKSTPGVEELTPDLARLRIAFVNVYFAGLPSTGGGDAAGADASTPWALVDAGLSMGTADILSVAAARFGESARPAAIILTHGHFDHVGALEALLGVWDVPVYAHMLELPFLTGRADYPPPDPTVGRGLMARLSPMFPERGIDLGDRVHALPADGTVPGMPGWRWIATPGHAPGHVSLFRDTDRVLVAGDAVTTTRQESVFSVMTQRQEMNGPPAYFTIDWDKARRSAETLAQLRPAILATGHGEPMRAPDAAEELTALAREFDRRARPAKGRYVNEPAITNEQGVVALPPRQRSSGIRWGMLSGVAAAAFAGTWAYRRYGKR
jgi:glyoxylase-like metal-dependent hydrolase (beta-lactamase superfamily II)